MSAPHCLRQRELQLTRLMERPADEINRYVAELTNNTRTLIVVLGNLQYENVDSLK